MPIFFASLGMKSFPELFVHLDSAKINYSASKEAFILYMPNLSFALLKDSLYAAYPIQATISNVYPSYVIAEYFRALTHLAQGWKYNLNPPNKNYN